MANLGTIKGWGNVVRSICVMPTATVANVAAPALATDGVLLYQDSRNLAVANNGLAFPNKPPRAVTLTISGTVTAGQVLVGTFTLWAYHPGLAKWIEIPVNGGTAITPVAMAETDTDIITYSQSFENVFMHYSRVALQLAGIGGAGASFEGWLTTALETT